MYQRILVAFDGSEPSRIALEHALALARDQRAQLRVVHALESFHYIVSAGGFAFDAEELMASLRREGERVLAQAQEQAAKAGVQAETTLLESASRDDRTSTILLREARRWNADLVVLGTHGRRGFDRVFLGSVAESLVRTATLPVLLVRAK
ncbi:MAG TPA: universal stress protein [Burkholderiaceae bacterium]|nr:universal stress protein [Burkholderiaceae bacterium]